MHVSNQRVRKVKVRDTTRVATGFAGAAAAELLSWISAAATAVQFLRASPTPNKNRSGPRCRFPSAGWKNPERRLRCGRLDATHNNTHRVYARQPELIVHQGRSVELRESAEAEWNWITRDAATAAWKVVHNFKNRDETWASCRCEGVLSALSRRRPAREWNLQPCGAETASTSGTHQILKSYLKYILIEK